MGRFEIMRHYFKLILFVLYSLIFVGILLVSDIHLLGRLSKTSDIDSVKVNFSGDLDCGFLVVRNNLLTINWKDFEDEPPLSNSFENLVVHPLKNKVNYSHLFNRTVVATINSEGFRGEKVDLIKGENITRILVLGDSCTFGYGLLDNETSPHLLEKKLNSGGNFEVLNFGVSDYDTDLEIERLIYHGLKWNPDIVILAYVSNDIEDTKKAREIQNTVLRCIQESELETNPQMKDFQLKYVGSMYHERYIYGLPFEEVWGRIEKPLRRLNGLASENDFEVIIVAFPSPWNHISQLRKTCKDYGGEFINLLDHGGFGDEDDWKLSDRIHPNLEANKRIAELLAEAVLV